MKQITDKPTRIKYSFKDTNYQRDYNMLLPGVALEGAGSIEFKSPLKGRVEAISTEDKFLGLVVVVKTANHYLRFLHLDTVTVHIGDEVKVGQTLGTFGLGTNNSIKRYAVVTVSTQLDDVNQWYTLEPDASLDNYIDPVQYLSL